MADKLTLVSHHLCPYVQRAVIALTEKQVPFERRNVDLARKPQWFTAISPLGKVPLLIAGEHVIFESAVILEYLEETQDHPLHPADPAARADHRSWIEFGSAILNDIAGFYSAPDEERFTARQHALKERFSWLETRLGAGPWFDASRFTLVDAVFGPIFRYFDTFDAIGDFGVFHGAPKTQAWRRALSRRPSVATAVTAEYPRRLLGFLLARNAHLSTLIRLSGVSRNEPASGDTRRT